MSNTVNGRRGGDGRWIGGIILVIVGVGLLLGQLVPDVGRYAALIVGLGLLVIFILTRNPGTLIGGCIVTGIGVGIVLDDLMPAADGQSWIPLCLGLGFLGIWVFGSLLRVPEARFWPLIPGGVLTFVGVAVLGGLSSQVAQYVWPVVLILIGLIAIARSIRRRPDAARPTTTTPSAAGSGEATGDEPPPLGPPADA